MKPTLPRRIYVASSWRNAIYPDIVAQLRIAGHEVYDFRNPEPGNRGFAWSEIDRDWLNWTPARFAEQLATHPIAAAGFGHDKRALDWCDTCILVLPCGRSAHLEAGYAAGQGKDVYFLLHPDKFEPELMYLLGTGCATSLDQILEWMAERQPSDVFRWHQANGGTFRRPANHALRLLREVIELCAAAGAESGEIGQAVVLELDKARRRGELTGECSFADLPQELADCAMLLEVLARHARINLARAVREKLEVLWNREWQADRGGALYRPGAAA